MSAVEVVERLSHEPNFKCYEFGRVTEAFARYRESHTGGIDSPSLHGPWDEEPDKIQWVDSDSDLDCMVSRGPLGNWCGYVGVPPGHPYHGVSTWEELNVDVHGGVTFTEFCAESESPEAICHVPLDGRPDRVWWIGFDCGHAWDLIPTMDLRMPGATYRDLAFVVDEVIALACQLRLIADGA